MAEWRTRKDRRCSTTAAVGSTLLVIFKSRCVKISICFGLWSCDREVQDESSDDDESIVPPSNGTGAQAANDQP